MNKILISETVPRDWGKVCIFMFYKKGATENLKNYRPIAFFHCLAKTFAQLICNWLVFCAAELHLISESQSGFRKGRGCLDNLFSLMFIIKIHLRKRDSVDYAACIHFKGAFLSISHHLLWNKLGKLGLSTKIIQILNQFYSNASTCIKTQKSSTDFVTITRGVLQGGGLSPF